jgi:hypothetical protein
MGDSDDGRREAGVSAPKISQDTEQSSMDAATTETPASVIPQVSDKNTIRRLKRNARQQTNPDEHQKANKARREDRQDLDTANPDAHEDTLKARREHRQDLDTANPDAHEDALKARREHRQDLQANSKNKNLFETHVEEGIAMYWGNAGYGRSIAALSDEVVGDQLSNMVLSDSRKDTLIKKYKHVLGGKSELLPYSHLCHF